MSVALVTLPPPPPPPPPEPPKAPAPKAVAAKARPETPKPKPPKPPPPRRLKARPAKAKPPPSVAPLTAAATASAADGTGVEVSEAELGHATVPGASGSGAGCDMPARLQRALRRDRNVGAAMAQAHRGRAIRVWDGAWVRHPGQDGAGLAAVREALTFEIAFAPEACRREPVQGLVLLSLGDGGGRVVLGTSAWRWSDLLFVRRGQMTAR